MELLSNSASGLREVAKWPFYLPHARPAKVSSSASVHGSVITDDATIEGDATVSHSVLSLQVTVGEQATIEDSILMPGVRVGKGARIRRAIIDENVSIPDGMRIGHDTIEDGRIGVVTKAGVVVIPANTSFDSPTRCPSSDRINSARSGHSGHAA